MKIERTLFWFEDEDKDLYGLTTDFFGLSTLLNRLMNETYVGKKIKFMNIHFITERTYECYPERLKNEVYYYNGHLKYYCVFDIDSFMKLKYLDKNKLLWQKAYDCLKLASNKLSNSELRESCEYAYKKGLEIHLNTDYKVLGINVDMFGKKMKASVWIIFKEDKMYSKFTLGTKEKTIYEQDIDSARKDMEFFLEIYKKIEVTHYTFIIRGAKDVEYLPLEITVEESMLNY